MTTDFHLPKQLKPQYSADEIKSAAEKIGSEITTWARQVWDDSHTDILGIPILRGGLFFFADLVRQIDASIEVAAAHAVAYEPGVNQALLDSVEVQIQSVPAKGRRILLVDDICDSGKTLKAMTQTLLEAGALEVRCAVLIQRIIPDQLYTPDWVGFEYKGPEWFVGYGMEDGCRWRNLPMVCIIQQDVKTAS